MRWDIIEKFEVLKKGRYSRARKSFTGVEDFFKEHFPGKPLVPEPLLIEMIAQAGGVLFGLGIDFKKEVVLAKIARARFHREVPPPCEFLVEATIREEREEGAWVAGTVRGGGQLVAEAEILLVTLGTLGQDHQKKVIFSDQFLKHFDIYHVAKTSEEVS